MTYKNKSIKRHGASVIPPRDPYAGFREVPDFTKVNGKPVSSSSTNEVMRTLDLMKKIAGGNRGLICIN